MLAERFASFKLLADQRNMEFTITLPEEPVTAYVDIDSLQKIVDNLFYNAINYGKSLVQCQLRKAADKFIVIFSNDGRLIPDELREKIFEPFYRMKASAGRSGTGIGLALARSLANLHKGRLYLKEPDKVMNIFVLEMPLKQAPDV
jgi:signal transduction histidine kinase